jgi:hypothetical protein
MNKFINVLLAASLLAPLAITAGVSADAAGTDSATTDGTIKFEKMDSKPEIIIPDSTPPGGGDSDSTDVPIPTPDSEPEVNVNGVYLLHAPSFDFNIHNISMNNARYNALKDIITLPVSTTNGGLFAIPSFLQVADFSGDNATQWAVTVKQDGLFTPEDGSEPLANARVKVNAMRMMNNLIPTSDFDDVYGTDEGLLIDTTTPTTIPVGTAIPVLDNTGDRHIGTNGTITSAVFNETYHSAADATAVALPTGVDQSQVNAATYFYDAATPDKTLDQANAALTALIYGAGNDMTNASGIINLIRNEKDSNGHVDESNPALALENENVWLDVPRTDRAQAKRYNTSFTWTLTVTP